MRAALFLLCLSEFFRCLLYGIVIPVSYTHLDVYKRQIPSGRKQYFIESLRVFGISESFVYPDLDHISSDLKDSYGI